MKSLPSVTNDRIDSRFQTLESVLPKHYGHREIMSSSKGYHSARLPYRGSQSARNSINMAVPRQTEVTPLPLGKPLLPMRARTAVDRSFLSGQTGNRRFSLPTALEGGEKSLTTLNFSGSGPLLKQRPMMARRNTVATLDRELTCMYKNSVEERRLQCQVMELEKRSLAGSLELRHQQRELLKQHRNTIQTSPSADQWLNMRKSRTASWQVREREDIAKRYSRRLRQFRAPPHLQQTVAKVRTYALLEAGLYRYTPDDEKTNQTNSETERDVDLEDNISRLTSLNIARRHTIADDAITRNLTPELRTESNRFRHLERRMTMDDIQSLQGLLELRRDHDLADLHSFSEEETESNQEKDDREGNSAKGEIKSGASHGSDLQQKQPSGKDGQSDETTKGEEKVEKDGSFLKILSDTGKVDAVAADDDDDSFDEELDEITDENWDRL